MFWQENEPPESLLKYLDHVLSPARNSAHVLFPAKNPTVESTKRLESTQPLYKRALSSLEGLWTRRRVVPSLPFAVVEAVQPKTLLLTGPSGETTLRRKRTTGILASAVVGAVAGFEAGNLVKRPIEGFLLGAAAGALAAGMMHRRQRARPSLA